MRNIDYIVIHCSAGFGDISSMKKFWKSLGWKQVGYHYFITTDGVIHTLASMSSPTNGVQGYNQQSIHICYQGGVKKDNVNIAEDSRTPEQKEALLKCIKMVYEDLSNYQKVDHIKILGHRDFSPDTNNNGVIESWERIKECPSFDARTEYAWIQGTKALKSNTIL